MTSTYWLDKGSHQTAEDGKCAMEWVSYVAGEPHSDRPTCVSPMLQNFCITLNDGFPDNPRQRMRPYLARCIGTAGDGLDESRRWLCADWLVREYAPAWLSLVPSLAGEAEALRTLSPVSVENLGQAMVDLDHARQSAAAAGAAARAAAGAAARAAARAAAGDAARAAAWAVAGDVAGAAAGAAARDAAWAAARDAAWDVAGAAARDAAWEALAPIVTALQDSVLSPGGLLDRMLPLEPLALPAVEEWRELCRVG